MLVYRSRLRNWLLPLVILADGSGSEYSLSSSSATLLGSAGGTGSIGGRGLGGACWTRAVCWTCWTGCPADTGRLFFVKDGWDGRLLPDTGKVVMCSARPAEARQARTKRLRSLSYRLYAAGSSSRHWRTPWPLYPYS